MSWLQLSLIFLVIFIAKPTESLRTCSTPGYNQLGSKCYRTVLTRGKTYDQAKSACASDGNGQLAMMATEEEAFAVLSSIALDSTWRTLRPYHRLWIGLNDQAQENVYVWQDGTNLADTSINLFAKRQGTNRPVRWDDCAQVHQYMRWMHRPCRDTSTRGFVCEQEPIGGPPDTLTECPAGGDWKQIGNKCFFLSKLKVNYFKAQGLCRQKHHQANLAKIESWQDMNSIINMMVEGSGFGLRDTLWFGASDFLSEGTFIYPDGSAASPLGGQYVFSAKKALQDFSLLGIDKWMTLAWYSGPTGYACSIDLDGLHSPVTVWLASTVQTQLSSDAFTDSDFDTCLDNCCSQDLSSCASTTYRLQGKRCSALDEGTSSTAMQQTAPANYLFTKEIGASCDSETLTQYDATRYSLGTDEITFEDVSSPNKCKQILQSSTQYKMAVYNSDKLTCDVSMYDIASNGLGDNYIRFRVSDVQFTLWRKKVCKICGNQVECLSGWTKVGSYCVKAALSDGSRLSAMLACSVLQPNSVLASFRESHASYASLWMDVGLSATDEMWVSATDITHNGRWAWQDDSLTANTPQKPDHSNYATATQSKLIARAARYLAKGYICEYAAGSPLP